MVTFCLPFRHRLRATEHFVMSLISMQYRLRNMDKLPFVCERRPLPPPPQERWRAVAVNTVNKTGPSKVPLPTPSV